MKLTNKQIKYLILFISIILIIIFIIIINKTTINNNSNKDVNTYITLSDVKQIKLSSEVIVLHKIDLDATQKSMLDIDKNNQIDRNDISVFKSIINDNFTDINNDNAINNKDLEELKKALIEKNNQINKDYDLNYDGSFNEIDVDLLQRYIANVIDLDINKDQKENYEDINILEKYINSKTQLNVFLPNDYTNTKITWNIEDNDIVKIDDDGILYPKKEGITKLSVKDYKGNNDECTIIVVDSNISEKGISLNKETIYLKPSFLTTVQTSASDINKDNSINALDLKLLKDIIKLQFGNINNDKTTDDKDLKLLNEYITRKKSVEDNYEKIDINKDGLINIKDYKLLSDYLYGDKMGDINKDNQVENRDIKLISDYINSYYQLYVNFAPNNTTNKKITWKSSNTNVATVTPEGIIYAHKEGEAIISATTIEGITKECKVIVSNNTNSPYQLKETYQEIKLKYFDYQNNDISKIDFNSDGIINKKDKEIAERLLKQKNSNKVLNKILEALINKEKYNNSYDINNDEKITIQDYIIIYNFVNEGKTGDVNNDNKFNKEDINLINNYIDSIKTINTKVDGINSMDRVLYLEENANVIDVDNEGNIKALNKGTTNITSMTVNGIVEKTKIIVE